MGSSREHTTVAAVVSMVLLVLLASQVVAVKHQTRVSTRKLLDTHTSGGSHGVVAVAVAAKRTTNTAMDECSMKVVKVTQDSAGHLPNGISSYYVTITNTCLSCNVRDVLISCGKFATTDPIQPIDFRRVTYSDCLVKNGGPIAPGETISFEYSNSFIYSFDVISFSCHDI